MKRKYDGYHFSHNATGVYNPFSLLKAMKDSALEHYWFGTGTPTVLIKSIQYYHTDLTQIEGSTALASEFDAPTEDMHGVLPLLYQSGYLTIKDYNPRSKRYTLGYPNEEVKVGMMQALIPYYVSADSPKATNAGWKISEALIDGDIDKALTVAQSYFASIPYQEDTLNDASTTEGHFTAMLYVVFSFINMYVNSQVRTSQGGIDMLVSTDTHIYVMELKIDSTPSVALAQIDDKGYAIPWQADGRKVVKVGINFSTKQRTIESWRTAEA